MWFLGFLVICVATISWKQRRRKCPVCNQQLEPADYLGHKWSCPQCGFSNYQEDSLSDKFLDEDKT